MAVELARRGEHGFMVGLLILFGRKEERSAEWNLVAEKVTVSRLEAGDIYLK